MDDFTKGIAFIFEGDTEREFYMVLLKHLCNKHDATLERIQISSGTEVIYQLITANDTHFLIKLNTVNTITQVPRAGQWFNTQCVNKYKSLEWHVFLCYDKDDYKEDISKFYEGDWSALRSSLKKAESIVDVNTGLLERTARTFSACCRCFSATLTPTACCFGQSVSPTAPTAHL